MKKLQGKNSGEASLNGTLLKGHRKETDVSTGKRKRPTVAEVVKTSQEEWRAKRARKENLVSPEVLVSKAEVQGRTLRSGRKISY
jgi:hypothetical protein